MTILKIKVLNILPENEKEIKEGRLLYMKTEFPEKNQEHY